MRPPLIGLFIGMLFTIFIWCAGPWLQETGFSRNVLEPLCTPMAYVISWITGISTHHESGILLLVYSSLITPALLGLIFGFIYSGVKILLNKHEEN